MPTTARRSPTRPALHALRQHTTGLVGALNAEWGHLVADPSSGRAVGRWAREHPVLAGLRDLDDVLGAACHRRDGDAVLDALLHLAREDALAARAALQLMLGAAVRLARRTVAHAGGDLEESLSRAVGALWDVVRDYPLERRACRPADGISLDVLAALTGAGRPRPVELPWGLAAELAELGHERPHHDGEPGVRALFWARSHPRAEGACSDEQLMLLLAWGVRTGVVALDDAQLLLRLHSPDQPGATTSCRVLAGELGLGHAAVRQRVSRATRRLAAAVAQQAETPAIAPIPSRAPLAA